MVDVGVADPGAQTRSRTGPGRVGDTEPFRISLTKKVVLSWLHCTCNCKNCQTGQMVVEGRPTSVANSSLS